MSIEGLGKQFQEARMARGLTLDEAARMTKIRPTRLAEIEADDFSRFPSLAYAKGFLLIYGKFLDVDVTPYLEMFETPAQVTVDGYSYLQEEPAPAPRRERAPRMHRPRTGRSSSWPFVIAIGAIIIGFFLMRLFLNIQRLAPRKEERIGVAEASPVQPPVITGPRVTPHALAPANTPKKVAPLPTAAPTAVAAAVAVSSPVIANTPMATAAPSTSTPATKQPVIRRAEPVRPEDLAKAGATPAATATAATATAAESGGPNHVEIKPLKKTYIKVVVDGGTNKPPFERWISPDDGTMEFSGQHIAVRVLDRDAVQIKKNGKLIAEGDSDVTVE
jgi:cytoskeletal protein RodZ